MTPRMQTGARPPCSALSVQSPAYRARIGPQELARQSIAPVGADLRREGGHTPVARRAGLGCRARDRQRAGTYCRCTITPGTAAPPPPMTGRIACGWRAPSTRPASAATWKAHWNRPKTRSVPAGATPKSTARGPTTTEEGRHFMRLNADLTLRAVVHASALPWQKSPVPGVERLMLHRVGDEVAQATSIVRLRAGEPLQTRTRTPVARNSWSLRACSRTSTVTTRWEATSATHPAHGTPLAPRPAPCSL